MLRSENKMIVEDIIFSIFLILCVIEIVILYYLMRTFLSIEFMVYKVTKKIDTLETKIEEIETKTDEIQTTVNQSLKKKHQT